MSSDRIAVLESALADQIAAGEVVERPASVVKELIENAVDAGATRVEVELEEGGKTTIRVIDDGVGIHPADLELALTRHATSKIRRADQLAEIHTLGFRGEALASIAAVARVRLRSRTHGAEVGYEVRVGPGGEPERAPVGMPFGTQVEVRHLFAAIPARKKFLRAEATEVGHCSDAVVRTALVHPSVYFSLRHAGRELVSFPVTDGALGERARQVLRRRSDGPFVEIEGEHEGVRIKAWLARPEAASRQRGATYVVVRRRVVHERNIARIVSAAYDLGAGASPHHPVACLWVDPPPKTVDVNVHPQKAEVRFSDPQTVYAAVRRVLDEGLAAADWTAGGDGIHRAAEGADRAGLGGALNGYSWSSQALASPNAASYRLGTRAAASGYAAHKASLRGEADALRSTTLTQAAADRGFGLQGGAGQESVTPAVETAENRGPRLLGILPGRVALFEDAGTLLVVDLHVVRTYLLRLRLERDLVATGVAAQGLLEPVLVERAEAEVALCVRHVGALSELGLDLEAFGPTTIRIRAVPAQLRECTSDADLDDLIGRLLPWLGMRDHEAHGEGARPEVAIGVIAETADRRDPAPRLARRWMEEVAASGKVDDVPGIRRYTASDLLDKHRPR